MYVAGNFKSGILGKCLYDCRESLTELGREGQVEGKPVR